MAAQTINASINLDAVAGGNWRGTDTFTVNNGATLTIDTTQEKGIGAITINQGKLRIVNATQTLLRVPMVYASSTTTNPIITSSGLASIEIAGDWLPLGLGDGTPGQAFTLPTTDYIPAVLVDGEIWTNLLTAMTPDIDHIYNGFKAVGSGSKGRFFRQTPMANPRQAARKHLTGCSSTVGSRVLTVPSTDGIVTGGNVTCSAGFAANMTIERVLSATELELHAAASGTASGITVTVVNAERAQYTNTIVFGDGVHGNVIPVGAEVKMPNIIVTSDKGVNFSAIIPAARDVNFNLSAGGSMVADKCILHFRNPQVGGAQKLHLSNVFTSGYLAPGKVYDFKAQTLAFGASPLPMNIENNHWRSLTDVSGVLWADYCAGTVDDLVIADAISGSGTASANAVLRSSYSKGIKFNKVRIQNLAEAVTSSTVGGFGLNFTQGCEFKDIEVHGLAKVFTALTGSKSLVEGVRWSTSGRRDHLGMNMSSGSQTTHGFLPDGSPLQSDVTYYLKPGIRWGTLEGQTWYGPELVIRPFITERLRFLMVGPASESSVRIDWTRTFPLHNAPAYEIFRSLDPAVPVRDATTRVFTTNTQATVTFTDTGLTEGQTYYYVFRKHESAGVYFDAPVQEATPQRHLTGFSSIGFTGGDVSNAAWIKSGCTAYYNVLHASPFYSAPGAFSGRAAATGVYSCVVAFTGAAGSLTRTVTGLVPGTTYTLSGMIGGMSYLPVNGPEVEETSLRVAFGTAFQDMSLSHDGWDRFDVVFTATAASHTVIFSGVTQGHWLQFGPMQIVNAQGAGLPILTNNTTTSVVNYVLGRATAICQRRDADHVDPLIQVQPLNATTLPMGWPVLHISTEKGFTPNLDNLLATTGSQGDILELNEASNDNTLRDIKQVGTGASNSDAISVQYSSAGNVFEDIEFNEGGNRGTTGGGVAYLINIALDSNDNVFRRCRFGVQTPSWEARQRFVPGSNDCVGNVFENVTAKSGHMQVAHTILGMATKGMSGGLGLPYDGYTDYFLGNVNDGTVATTLTAVYDVHYAEMIHTDTTGALNLFFTASTKASPPYEITGGAAFSNTGALYLQTPGDSYTYTWPHRIIGVSGFRNMLHRVWMANLGWSADYVTGALLIEYQIDTGAGWTAWAEATPESLSLLTLDPVAGFFFRVRITARQFVRFTSQVQEFTVGEVVRHSAGGTATVTTIDDRGTFGVLALENIEGAWTSAGGIVRHSNGQAMASVFNTDGQALGPTANSLIRALQIHVTRDPTSFYPVPGVLTSLQAQVSLIGAEIRIYDLNNLPAGSLGVELAGTESSGSTFTFDTNAGNIVWIQVMAPGYEEYGQQFTVPTVNSTISLILQPDLNN